jgi:cytochrome c biogenesis protein CcmG, thiol:disulfide interchange protein DsbE
MRRRSPRTRAILLLIAGILIAIGWFVSNARGGDTPAASRLVATDLDGNELQLEKLTGKGPVLLDFWATWCKPCAASLPEIQSLHEKLAGRGLTIVGVSIDGPRNFSKVRPFVARTGLTYPIVIDQDGRLQREFHVTAVPTTILIDSTGAIVRVHQGYRPGEEKILADEIEALLSKTGGAQSDSTPPPDSTGSGAH